MYKIILILLVITTLTGCFKHSPVGKPSKVQIFYSVYLPQAKSDFSIQIHEDDSICFTENQKYWKCRTNPLSETVSNFKLDKKEVKKLYELLELSNVFELKDTYGDFSSRGNDNLTPILIFIISKEGRKKYITIKNKPPRELLAFSQFYEYLMELQIKYYSKSIKHKKQYSYGF